MLTADVEKIAELASAADGLYGMTRSCYGSGWFSPSSSQNRNFAIVAKKPKWNRVTNCRWTLRYDKIMLWVRVVRGTLIWASYHPLTLKIGNCKVFLQKPLIAIELLSSFKFLEMNLTCSPNLTFTLYCSNAVPPPLHCDELHMFSCNGGPRSEGFLLIIYLLWGFLNTFMSGSLRVFSLPTEEVTLPVY